MCDPLTRREFACARGIPRDMCEAQHLHSCALLEESEDEERAFLFIQTGRRILPPARIFRFSLVFGSRRRGVLEYPGSTRRVRRAAGAAATSYGVERYYVL